MRHILLFICITALIAGCADQAPAPSTGSEGSDMAAIVASVVGAKSHGLVADLQDLLSATNADSIDALQATLHLPAANIHRVGMAGSTPANSNAVRFERNYVDTMSEWKRNYTVTPMRPAGNHDTFSIVAASTGQGTYRNGDLTLQTELTESIQIARTADGYQISGEHIVDGDATVLANSTASYHDVTVKITLASLAVESYTPSTMPSLSGRCDVAISAGSTHGTLSVTGTVIFNDSATARLLLDGKEYLIDLKQARVITGGV